MAQKYYDLVTETDSDTATIDEFMRVCPPFKALIYAMFGRGSTMQYVTPLREKT